MRALVLSLFAIFALAACQTGPAQAPMHIETQAPETGSLHRSYYFAEAEQEMPYRLYVPTTWDGASPLPVILFLHGGGSDENRYLDANDRQLERLAEQHGFLLVSPLGYTRGGAYGAAMMLGSAFGELEGQRRQRAQVNANPERLRELALSERDTLNVLDRVIAEYGVNPREVFLAGHSMGSGGAWYLGNKYPQRWAAIAPMSGPFAEAALDPFANLQGIPIYYTEGIQTPSLQASRLMAQAAQEAGLEFTYQEFDGTHGGMIPMAAPSVFEFFTAQLARIREARRAQ